MKVLVCNVFTVFAIIQFIQGATMPKPMGIKMCERQCQCLKGCYAIQYDTVCLQCITLTDLKDEVKVSSSLLTKTVSSTKDSLPCQPQTCSEGERSVMNRHHQLVCVPSEVLTPKVQQDWRLLVVSQSPDNVFAFEMNLVTGQFRKHPFYWYLARQILSVGKEMKLFMITYENLVMTVSHNQSMVWRDVRNVIAMCADEGRDMLFLFASISNLNDMYRMTTAGQRKRRILRLKTHSIYAADADPDQQNVYFLSYQGVFSLGYDGSNEHIIYTPEGIGVFWLRYNIEYKEAYYYDQNTKAIKARSADGTRLVLKSDIPPDQVQICDGVMYFVFKEITEKFYSVNVRGEDNGLRMHVLPEHSQFSRQLILSIIAAQI